ncbi:MAG: transposase [Mesorhizobium sp.]|nr:MAG: transposase [Mesorhizobium sp.]
MTTVDHDMLIATLDRLKLMAIRDQLDTLLDEAARSKMTLREALGFLVSREIGRRDERRISMSSKIAQFPFVRDLAAGAFVADQHNVVLVGGTGTGKSHLAIAIARSLIRSGARGRFFNVVDLVNRLKTETRAGRQGRIADHLTRLDFIVFDELGYLPFAQAGGQLLFHLVSKLYERTSVIITTNPAFGEWPMATAILDRLLHHSTVITIRGDSYRLREKHLSGLPQKT